MSSQSQKDDLKLVEKARCGDRDAFACLYEKYRQKVFYICWKFCNNKDTAMDLMQDVFVKLMGKLDKYRDGASFSTWLHRVATNHCIDHFRKTKNQRQQTSLSNEYLNEELLTGLHIACGVDPAKQSIDNELARIISAAVETLSEKHQEIFKLHAIKGMSYKEISQTLGCTQGTVMSRLYYARKYLQEKLENYL